MFCDLSTIVCLSLRRTLDYQEVLDALSQKGIAIRVASPKLVMEEVGRFVVCEHAQFRILWNYSFGKDCQR